MTAPLYKAIKEEQITSQKMGKTCETLSRRENNLMSVKGTDVKQKNNMNKDVKALENSPLINEETFCKMEKVQAYLKEQGVKPVKYDTLITNCSSCGGWSAKQKCNG